jgi:NAD(P)H dehydrogenase (quinone)
MSVIVTGASGKLGRLVAENLMDRLPTADLVLVSRHPEALRDFAARGADVRYGDFDEPLSLRDAFAGGDRMLLISTDAVGRRFTQHRAANDAGVAPAV